MDKHKFIHGGITYIVKSWCLMSGIVLFNCAFKVTIGNTLLDNTYFWIMILTTSCLIHLFYEIPYKFRTLRNDLKEVS